ncbi:MAG TPA: hypothetical protein VMD59_23495, partial [Acidimicrobiales bacterium]|nr:hypothetical protein [Acidimicrobiales bacterium]
MGHHGTTTNGVAPAQPEAPPAPGAARRAAPPPDKEVPAAAPPAVATVAEGLSLLWHGLGVTATALASALDPVRVASRLPGPLGRVGRLRRRRLYGLLASGVLVVLAAGAVVAKLALAVVAGEPPVVVATAGPASIDAQPGGVGTLAAVPADDVIVSLDTIGVDEPIVVSRVLVVPGATVHPGTPLLALDPAPLEDDVAQVRITLQQAEATLATDERNLRSPGAKPGSYANVYLATQIPTVEGS